MVFDLATNRGGGVRHDQVRVRVRVRVRVGGRLGLGLS